MDLGTNAKTRGKYSQASGQLRPRPRPSPTRDNNNQMAQFSIFNQEAGFGLLEPEFLPRPGLEPGGDTLAEAQELECRDRQRKPRARVGRGKTPFTENSRAQRGRLWQGEAEGEAETFG